MFLPVSPLPNVGKHLPQAITGIENNSKGKMIEHNETIIEVGSSSQHYYEQETYFNEVRALIGA